MSQGYGHIFEPIWYILNHSVVVEVSQDAWALTIFRSVSYVRYEYTATSAIGYSNATPHTPAPKLTLNKTYGGRT